MKLDRLSKLVRLDRLQCSPAAVIAVILIGFAGWALSQHPSAPATTYDTAPAAPAAVGHPSHYAIGLIVAAVVVAVLLIAATVVRALRGNCRCWRPGMPIPALRLNQKTGVLEPVEVAAKSAVSAESVTETGSDGAPVVISLEGVSTGGGR